MRIPASFIAFALLTSTAGAELPPIAEMAPELSLTDFRGRQYTSDDFADSRTLVVAFLGTECPLAKLYGPRLQQLADEFGGKGVAVIGIFSNSQDGVTDIDFYARRHEVKFPLLKDPGNKFADAVGARRTPHVFVYNESRQLVYHGRIDEQYGVGYGRHEQGDAYLRDAIEATLAGDKPAISETKPVGCIIGRVRTPDADSEVTYTNQVVRVLQRNCVECHRKGEIAPFTLTDYEEVAGWADTIAEVVKDRRMPPWGANPNHGEFANAREMTSEEKQILYDWAAAGAPQGDPADMPEPMTFTEGWRLPREPDVVLAMRSEPYDVPAEGVVEYQYFAVDPGFKEDKWVKASDIVPGDRTVVHHTIVYISPPGADRRRGLGWLSAYVPGQSSMLLPDGHARLIPAGSKLIFEQHYTPNGRPAKDLTKIGLVLAKPEEVTREVVTLFAVNSKFEIPPRTDDYLVKSSIDFWPQDAKLMAFSPHMHLRGKTFRYTGVWPDGRKEVLLDVPDYDFNWQHGYELAEQIPVEQGFKLECEATFDNSENNPANPDPDAAVRWGQQSFQEMMLGFLEISVPLKVMDRPVTDRDATEEELAEAKAVASKLFKRFDRNKDKRLTRRELPDAFGLFALRRYDTSGDKVLEFAEVEDAALQQAMRP